MNWKTLEENLKNIDKKDIIIYDDTVVSDNKHTNGNQAISVMYKGKFQYRINRPQMNKLKKMGYKVTRRELK